MNIKIRKELLVELLSSLDKKPFIVSAFMSAYEDSAYREFTVFGEANANRVFKDQVNADYYDYVRLDEGVINDHGLVEYSRKGKIKSWIRENRSLRSWFEEFNYDETPVPFWVNEDEKEFQYAQSDERYCDMTGCAWDV